MDDKDEDIELNDTPRRRPTRSGRRETRRQAPEPKVKYMEQLQEIANRERQALTIELEDLKEVREFLLLEALF
jgi:DNA replication licensing factor MCM7